VVHWEANQAFRYASEISLHSVERCTVERWVGFARTIGIVLSVLDLGLSDDELGLTALRGAAERALGPGGLPWYVSYRVRVAIWGLGALCAVAPDLDVVVTFLFGIPYSHMLGHRGLSHSLLVAAMLATLVTAVARRNLAESPGTAKLWLFFFLATASHALLDSMTNGGLGVAFFAPFFDTRYFLP